MGPLTRRITKAQAEQPVPEQEPTRPAPFIPAWRRRAMADVERVGYVAVSDLSERRNAA